jgi:hypothetical protein
MDGIWIVYLVLAAIPGVILFAVVYKYVEVARAKRWPGTPGKVVASAAEARDVDVGGPNSTDTERRNFALIVYAYTVAGREYRCDRVSIGENMGNFEVAETLAKYPVGTTVTVYYNPSDPAQAVIERDLPPGLWKAPVILVAVIVALVAGATWGFQRLVALLSGIVTDPARAPFVTACAGFALMAALMVLGLQRHVGRMRRWPVVPGRIESADVRAFEARDSGDGAGSPWITHHRADVVYSYAVGGVRYTGDKRGTTGRFSSNISAFARKSAQRYKPGSTVKIHYNPDNPAESILDPRPGPLWLLWLIPLGLLALAWFVGR